MGSFKAVLCILLTGSFIVAAKGQGADTVKTRYCDRLLDRASSVFYANPDSSLYYTTRALEFAKTHKLEIQIGRALYSQAKTEVLKGDIASALKKLKDAITIFEKHKAARRVAKSYELMSTAFDKINNFTESINLLLRSVTIYRKLNDEDGLNSSLVNLANTYSKIKEFDKALKALAESKRFNKPGDQRWFYYYINAGVIYQEQKKYLFAKTQFDSCIAISHRHNMVDAEVTAITDMASLYLDMNKDGEAFRYYDKAINMARAHHLPIEESEALIGLMTLSEKTGDYKNAFTCQNRLKVISDSLFNIEKIKNINAIEARLKVSEKEKTIALQN